MSHKLIALVALICTTCAVYLLCNSMELENFFLTRWTSKLFFPRLDPHRRHQRMTVICGIILATIITVFIVIFAINRLNRR